MSDFIWQDQICGIHNEKLWVCMNNRHCVMRILIENIDKEKDQENKHIDYIKELPNDQFSIMYRDGTKEICNV